MKNLAVVFFVGAFSMGVYAQGKELKVAIEATYEPFTFKTPDGKPTGFDVDIANALCEQMKRKCVFVEQVWDSMIPGLQAKKYDAIISSMAITEDRLKVVDFSDRYYFTGSTVVVKNSIPYANDASLNGLKLGVIKGTTQEKYGNGELKKVGAVITPYESQSQVYLDIMAGRLDGTISDIVEVNRGFLSKPEGKGYKAVGEELYAQKYFGYGVGVAVRKGDATLKNELNSAIKAIRTNGVYKTVNDKYFDFDVYGTR